MPAREGCTREKKLLDSLARSKRSLARSLTREGKAGDSRSRPLVIGEPSTDYTPRKEFEVENLTEDSRTYIKRLLCSLENDGRESPAYLRELIGYCAKEVCESEDGDEMKAIAKRVMLVGKSSPLLVYLLAFADFNVEHLSVIEVAYMHKCISQLMNFRSEGEDAERGIATLFAEMSLTRVLEEPEMLLFLISHLDKLNVGVDDASEEEKFHLMRRTRNLLQKHIVNINVKRKSPETLRRLRCLLELESLVSLQTTQVDGFLREEHARGDDVDVFNLLRGRSSATMKKKLLLKLFDGGYNLRIVGPPEYSTPSRVQRFKVFEGNLMSACAEEYRSLRVVHRKSEKDILEECIEDQRGVIAAIVNEVLITIS